MDIPTLETFLAVADSGSFSRAAEHLHLTQPAVSKRIAALESDLGMALFERVGRHVALTDAGQALLPRARGLLDELEDTRRALTNLSGRVAGRLRIGTSHHIGLHRLPSVLRAYTEDYPDVVLDLHFMDSEAACQAVLRGELELAIVTLPTDPPPRLDCQPVWQDVLQLVAARDHQLARIRRVTPAELADHPAILPGEGTFTRKLIDEAFAQVGYRPQVHLSTNYLETIKMMVSIGLGWSVLPQTMVDKTIKPLDFSGTLPVRMLGIVLNSSRTISNPAAALIRLLDQQRENRARSSR
jgi:DNA-binding transcriptional LysR family regulator